MGGLRFQQTPLSGLVVLDAAAIVDDRGTFTRLYRESEFNSLLSGISWKQIHLSQTTSKGCIRGLHFQHPPAAEMKLITCLRGSVFDVAVDLRAGSPTFGHWYGVELSERTARQILIPEGFAHGFQALTTDVELLYFHTAEWSPTYEGGIRFDDPTLSVHWPLPATQVSERDRNLPTLSTFAGIRL